jgi:hypothetical protein
MKRCSSVAFMAAKKLYIMQSRNKDVDSDRHRSRIGLLLL